MQEGLEEKYTGVIDCGQQELTPQKEAVYDVLCVNVWTLDQNQHVAMQCHFMQLDLQVLCEGVVGKQAQDQD